MEFNRLIPELSVNSLPKSLQFYVDILGFKIEYRREETKFAFVSFQGSQLMLEEQNGHWETGELVYPFGRGINFQMEVEDLDEILKALEKAKYSLWKEPWESWYRQDEQLLGQRECLVQDHDGYLLRFAQDMGIKPVIAEN